MLSDQERFQEILDGAVEFHPIATDALTGEATDLRDRISDQASLQAALRASMAMPLLAGDPVEIGGRRFVDAGVSESVPVRTALAQRATHIVALRTRRADEAVSAPSRGERLVLSRWFARHAPGALEPWLRRQAIRAKEEEILASHPTTLQIRPPAGSAHIGRTERGPRSLRAAVDTGRQAAWNQLAGPGEPLPEDRGPVPGRGVSRLVTRDRRSGEMMTVRERSEATMFTSIAGRAVVVTGGTRGIGKGIAAVFAGAGARVLITGRDEETARKAADEAGATGYVVADVASKADCAKLAATAAERLGGLDVLCANAGIFPSARLADLAEDDIDRVLGVNLKGTILTVQACLPLLRASGHGRVILTSSITGPVTGYPGWTHYGASKAGQLGFMRTAAIELARDGVTVNAVLPGNIKTEGLAGLGDDYVNGMTAAIPMRRLGTIEEIGHTVLFLATDEAGYITGQTIVVDGGQTLPESPEAVS